MGVALSRDRIACVTVSLGAGAHLFAVAEGFGRIDGLPIAHVAVQRLRLALERQRRSRRLPRALAQPETAAILLAGAIARLNDEIFARTASHADYISAGCSLTAVLVVRRTAIAAHLGATAAYLERDGQTRALTTAHVMTDLPVRVLTRSLGTQARSDPSIATFEIDACDTLVLTDSEHHRMIVRPFSREVLDEPVASVPSPSFVIPVWAAAAIAFVLAVLCTR